MCFVVFFFVVQWFVKGRATTFNSGVGCVIKVFQCFFTECLEQQHHSKEVGGGKMHFSKVRRGESSSTLIWAVASLSLPLLGGAAFPLPFVGGVAVTPLSFGWCFLFSSTLKLT